jgi:hypothetical protein
MTDDASRLQTGQRYEFVCLQIDIAGHSKLTDAERFLHAAKSRFHIHISGVIASFQGQPFKWEGDGGAFLFLVTNGMEYDEAVFAAFRILDSMPSINEELHLVTNISQPLAVRISLDSGQAIYDEIPGRITGDFLNAFLKNERAIALVDTVTITDRTHRQLSDRLRGRFTERLRSEQLGCELHRSSRQDWPANPNLVGQDEEFMSDDIRLWFKDIKGMNQSDLTKDADQAVTWLLYNGIKTKGELRDLVRATHILDVLGKLYVEELGRAVENPLDPVAIATWGTFLLFYGPRAENIEIIRRQLRTTPEYREKHPN